MIQAIDSAMAANNPEDIPSKADLMTRYLPALEAPDFRPGELTPIRKTESGSIIMPYVIFGDVAETFITAAYEYRWVLRGFD